jgi:hypothetical protein
MLEKELNLIVYKPGYGGRFVSGLLSLDESVYPPFFLEHDKTASRKTIFSYKDIRKNHKNWSDHHNLRSDTLYQSFYLEEFSNSEHRSWVAALHPHEYYDWFFEKYEVTIRNKIGKINYIHIQLSDHLEIAIDKFKNHNNGFPKLRIGENELDHRYAYETNPFVINLDKFVLGEETFIPEYRKICNYLQIPYQTTDALELYRDWYLERKFLEYLS